MAKSAVLFGIFMVISLLLVASCVTRQVPVVETYYETEYKTEYKTETYTETVDTVISSKEGATYMNPQTKWYTDIARPGFEGSGGTYYYHYIIEATHSENQVQINLSQNVLSESGVVRVYDLSATGPIPPRPTPMKKLPFLRSSEIEWLNNLNAVLNTSPLLGEVRFGSGATDQIVFDTDTIREFGIFATTWNTYAIRSVKLLWTDEVIEPETITEEREVPYQVPYQVEKQRTVYKTETVPLWDIILGR